MSKGFSLLELVVAVAVWMILIAGAARLIWYVSHTTANTLIAQEALESARIAVDTLTVNMQMADEILLRTNLDGTFRSMTTWQINPQGRRHDYDFYFNRALGRLVFDRNELTSNIDEVELRLCARREIIHISITSGQITLTGAVNVQHKIVR